MIKNILFDMGGVLVGFDKQRCVDAFAGIGATGVGRYVEEKRTEDLFAQIELGEISTADFCNHARRIAQVDVPDQALIEAWEALLTPCTAEKKQRLLELKRHYRLFLLSNTNEMHWLQCRDRLIGSDEHPIGDYFEQCFLSYEMHLAKPSEEIYREVLRRAEIKADETLFIDDSLENLEAAARLGLQIFHENDNHHWVETL